MEDTDSRVHPWEPWVIEQLRVHLDAADERVPHPEDVAVHLRLLGSIPKLDIDPAAIRARFDPEHSVIFVDRTHDDVRVAPSSDVSTNGEELEHVAAVIGSGAEVLHRVRGLQRTLADNLDGGPAMARR